MEFRTLGNVGVAVMVVLVTTFGAAVAQRVSVAEEDVYLAWRQAEREAHAGYGHAYASTYLEWREGERGAHQKREPNLAHAYLAYRRAEQESHRFAEDPYLEWRRSERASSQGLTPRLAVRSAH